MRFRQHSHFHDQPARCGWGARGVQGLTWGAEDFITIAHAPSTASLSPPAMPLDPNSAKNLSQTPAKVSVAASYVSGRGSWDEMPCAMRSSVGSRPHELTLICGGGPSGERGAWKWVPDKGDEAAVQQSPTQAISRAHGAKNSEYEMDTRRQLAQRTTMSVSLSHLSRPRFDTCPKEVIGEFVGAMKGELERRKERNERTLQVPSIVDASHVMIALAHDRVKLFEANKGGRGRQWRASRGPHVGPHSFKSNLGPPLAL